MVKSCIESNFIVYCVSDYMYFDCILFVLALICIRQYVDQLPTFKNIDKALFFHFLAQSFHSLLFSSVGILQTKINANQSFSFIKRA